MEYSPFSTIVSAELSIVSFMREELYAKATAMEGRLAIFTEKWIVALVKVHSIRVTDRAVFARIQSIPTQGLYGKNEISIGCVHEYLQFGKEIWRGIGYCGWCLFFAPALIEEVIVIATSFPRDWVYDPADRYFEERNAALLKPLLEYKNREAPHPDLEFFRKIGGGI